MRGFLRSVGFDAERAYGNLSTGWSLFLAYFHLSDGAVCRMSQGRSVADDFHTHRDTDDAACRLRVTLCRRCGKEYWLN